MFFTVHVGKKKQIADVSVKGKLKKPNYAMEKRWEPLRVACLHVGYWPKVPDTHRSDDR